MSSLPALLRKDLPWLLFFLVGGTVGHVLALCVGSFVHTFVVSPGDRSELFHVAWSCGMGLGVVAFAFDEILGARELLVQRPVTAADVMRARFAGCTLVLASWMLLAPIVAYLLMAFEAGTWEWGHWQQWPAIWSNMAPAWSACALAGLATSLPFVWWMRLLCLGAMFLLSFSAIFWCERDGVWGLSSLPAFVAGHGIVAILATMLAWRVRGGMRDTDRPVDARGRRTAILPMLVVAALATSVGLTILEANAAIRLRNCYPCILQNEGRYLLAVRPEWREPWVVVDARHAPTGQRIEDAEDFGREGSYLTDDFVRLEGPRAAHFMSSFPGPDGRIVVDADGTPWWVPLRASLRRLAKSPSEPRFAPGTRVDSLTVGSKGTRVILLFEPRGDSAWRFDAATAGFERLPLADGDHALDFMDFRRSSSTSLPSELPVGFELAKGEDVIRAQRFVYALRDGQLQKLGAAKEQSVGSASATDPVRLTGIDGLGWVVEIDANVGTTAFRHHFAPRTFAERAYAGAALLLAGLRPPVLQLAAAFGPATDEQPDREMRWQWLLDPLVAAGRRWWLVGLCVALAVVLVWSTRRRLRRLGADAGTIRFWSCATILLGPVGAWAGILCERPRRWADRNLGVSSTVPRIVSVDDAAEHVA